MFAIRTDRGMVFGNMVVHPDFEGEIPPLSVFTKRKTAQAYAKIIKQRYELRWYRTVPCVIISGKAVA